MDTSNDTTLTDNILNTSVLIFLAENVNIYNYYLLRGSNPSYAIYDNTDDTLQKLHNTLFQRAEENNEVCIKLKNTVLTLKLTEECDGNHMNAYLLCLYIQQRQYKLHHEHVYPEYERMLCSHLDYDYTQIIVYKKLKKLEEIYLDILSYNEPELLEHSYNNVITETGLPLLENTGLPEYGCDFENQELQIVYLSFNMGFNPELIDGYEYVKSELQLKVIDTITINIFNCSICLEDQSVGSVCALTICRHQYCTPCFKSMVLYNPTCALCRKEITEYFVSIVE